MKKIPILLIFVLAAAFSNAQKTNSTKSADGVRVVVTVTPNVFESNLAAGKLNLLKTLTIDQQGSAPKISYSLAGSSIFKSFNSGKPLEIKLSKNSFEGALLRALGDTGDKSSALTQFVQQKNLSLDDEKEWIALINYYNNL
jgi:hypothetical protein